MKTLTQILLMHAVDGILEGCGNSYANAYTEKWLRHAKALGAYHGRTIGTILELKTDWQTWLDANGGLPDLPDTRSQPKETISGKVRPEELEGTPAEIIKRLAGRELPLTNGWQTTGITVGAWKIQRPGEEPHVRLLLAAPNADNPRELFNEDSRLFLQPRGEVTALDQLAAKCLASPPHSVPMDVMKEIIEMESKRLNLAPEHAGFDDCFASYFPRYRTACPGYSGPLVVIVWALDPNTVSTFIKQDGKWVACHT